MKRILEICCDHLGSALAAQKGGSGSNRALLCAFYRWTYAGPRPADRSKKSFFLSLFFVLIRPRPGNFVYSDLELEAMLSSIQACKALGADGIVSGALHSNMSIDIEATEKLIAAARPLPFTFHKAFDLTPDAFCSYR